MEVYHINLDSLEHKLLNEILDDEDKLSYKDFFFIPIFEFLDYGRKK